jgi:transposase
MSSNRKKYSAGEKAKIALEAIKGNMTMAEIVGKYSVHPTQVNKWKKQVIEQLPEIFSTKSGQMLHEHENKLAMLYEQIGRLKVENEFLKKKCDLFT